MELVFHNADGAKLLDERIVKGELIHLDGARVKAGFDAFLRTTDGRLSYPIFNDIILLLPHFAIARLEDVTRFAPLYLSSQTHSVMRFYDEIGWTQLDDGSFWDAENFEDLRAVSREYIHRCHLRINRHIGAGGKYLLDIACGPLQYDEYLDYSSGYEKRICCDVSLAALKFAKSKLGEKAVYVQCDITNIPLKDCAVDGFVSLHTVYHVPAEKQATAFQELARVLCDGGSGVVVYSWGHNCRLMKLLMLSPGAIRSIARKIFPASLVQWLKRNRGSAAEPQTQSPLKPNEALYFHAHDYAWYEKQIAAQGNWTVYVWRSVSVEFLRRYVHAAALGQILLKAIFRLEEAFPTAFGRFGQYPMLVLNKARPGAGAKND